MIIVLKHQTTRADADELIETIRSQGLTPLHMPGTERVVLGALGDERVLAWSRPGGGKPPPTSARRIETTDARRRR